MFLLEIRVYGTILFQVHKGGKNWVLGTGCQTSWKTAAWHLLSRLFPEEKQQQAAIYRAAIAKCLRERDRKIL